MFKIDKIEDFRAELKRLNRGMRQQVVDLMMGEKSLKDSHVDDEEIGASIEKKLMNIRDSAINMHHMLNMYRRHQSRQTILLLMKGELRKNKAALEKLNSSIAEASKKLGNAGDAAMETSK